MSANLRGKFFFATAVFLGSVLLLITALSPGRSEDYHHKRHDRNGGGVDGVGIGIDLGTQLLKRRAKKPTEPSTVSKTGKKHGKKQDKTKTPEKEGKPKPPPPKKKDERPPLQETDCVIYMQYVKDNPEEGSVASNIDIEQSAKALREKLQKQAGKENIEDIPFEKVTSTITIEQALAKIKAKNKCCTTLHIVSHGSNDGELDLPYDLPDKNNDLAEADKDKGMLHKLGGPNAKMGWGSNRLTEFAATLKKHLCKGGSVVFDGCWAGKEGGIAEQVAGQGIPTKGFPGYCELGPEVDEKTGKKFYSPPRPGKDEHASDPLKAYPAKEPEKPKTPEKPTKKK